MDVSLEGSAPEAPAARKPRALPILTGLLVFALVAAGTFAYLWATVDEPVTSEDVAAFLGPREEAVTERASEVIDLMLTYDSTNIEDVGERMIAISTGRFRDKYEDLVGGGNLRRALTKAAASSRGQILDGPDVYFRDPTEAVALVSVSQVAQSKSNPAGVTTDLVMQMTIQLIGGEWKVSWVDVLSQQTV